MDARGVKDDEILPGVQRSNMPELSDYTISADKVLVF
jgi:sulfur relay (sulfurtransferase) complex TusBCD TusD component (DsrE family)